ncbi:MAG: AraC family transcriptional regulator [Verrucomicrobiota bacterium JB022]|nr:AraC family transcriptional regulator [Verrucomicrobiota bacterium JB022]
MAGPTYSSPNLFPTLGELGVDPAKVLRATGLPLTLASQHPLLLDTEQLFRFWEGLERVADDPLIGVRVACRAPRERFHPASIAAHHARTFREALQRLARYKALCCAEEMRLIEQGDLCLIELRWIGSTKPAPARFIDAIFASQTELGRRGTGLPLNPRRVELARAPEAVEAFEAFYGCRVQFCASANRLVFARADLDLPFTTYNAALLEMLAPSLDQALAKRVATRSIADQVRWVAQRLMAGGLPPIADVAGELGMSSRSLQRRIAEEGTSFRELLTDARRELARQYLSEPTLNLVEVACLLGFQDPNSFYRSFRDWEGQTPGEWREAQSLTSPSGGPSSGAARSSDRRLAAPRSSAPRR